MNAELSAEIRDFVAGLGYRLWGVRWYKQGRDRHLQVFIDHNQLDQGQIRSIDVDDCARVSRSLAVWLDVELPEVVNYVLEVSSPGIDRLLFEAEQFNLYIGELVALRLRSKISGRKNIVARIVGSTESTVELKIDEKTLSLAFVDIQEARLKPEKLVAKK